MIRPALIQAARCASRASFRHYQPVLRPAIIYTTRAAIGPAQRPPLSGVRCYSAPAGLSEKEVEGRIMDILKNFDKVEDVTKLTPKSHFANDLGLDSLDTVEVVMAIEEEFSIEIPDKEADAIHSIDKAIQYILSQPDAH